MLLRMSPTMPGSAPSMARRASTHKRSQPETNGLNVARPPQARRRRRRSGASFFSTRTRTKLGPR
eukprot:4410499-Prymnesium_polylepis.1